MIDNGKDGKPFCSLPCCLLLYYGVSEARFAKVFFHCCSSVIDVLKCSPLTDFVVNLESQENVTYCAEKWESSGENGWSCQGTESLNRKMSKHFKWPT